MFIDCLSPDGWLLAVETLTPAEIWVYDIPRGTLSRLTFEGAARPLWSPDGKRIDLGTQGTDPASAHKHAMGGMKGRYSGGQEPESCSEAYDGAIRNLNQDIANGDIMGGLHEIEDSYASGHLYQPWTGVQSAAHKSGDQVIIPAAEAAAQAFLTALWQNKPLGKAQDYLAPRPANCK